MWGEPPFFWGGGELCYNFPSQVPRFVLSHWTCHLQRHQFQLEHTLQSQIFTLRQLTQTTYWNRKQRSEFVITSTPTFNVSPHSEFSEQKYFLNLSSIFTVVCHNFLSFQTNLLGISKDQHLWPKVGQLSVKAG